MWRNEAPVPQAAEPARRPEVAKNREYAATEDMLARAKDLGITIVLHECSSQVSHSNRLDPQSSVLPTSI